MHFPELDPTTEQWRTALLRLAAIAMMAGVVAVMLIQSGLPPGIGGVWPAYMLACIACLGTIFLTQLDAHSAALHFFLWVGWVAISALAYLEGDPGHFVVQSATIAAALLIALVGRPRHAFLVGGLGILTSLLLTFLFSSQIIRTAVDVTWVQSIGTVVVYLAVLFPFGFASWAVNTIIEQLLANNRQLLDEIEARKDTEQAMLSQNEWFRSVLDGSPDLFVVFDNDGKLVDVNRAVCEKLGYSREEILGMPISELDIKWAPERLRTQIGVELPVGTSEVISGRIQRKDGSTFPVEVAISILEDEGQRRGVGFGRDITERQSAEIALQQSEEKFRSIYNTAGAGMYLVDTEGVLVDINDRWLEMMGYSREEMLGRPSIEFLTPASRKQAVEIDFPLFFKQGYVKNLPHQVTRKNGEIFDILLNGTLRKDEEGNFIGILTSIIDVTEQRRLQAEVEKSEQRFRAVFNNTFSFIGLMEPNGTLLEANEAALAFGGLAPVDALYRPFWETYWWQISCETQAQLKTAIDRAAQGEFIRYEVDIWGAEQSVHTIDFTIKPIFDQAGNVILLLPEGRIITELRDAERQLIQSEYKFRVLFNGSSDLTLVLSPEGIILDANDRVDSSSIGGRAAMLGYPVWKLRLSDTSPLVQPRVQEMFEQVIAKKSSIREELEVHAPLRGQLFLDVIMTPVINNLQQIEMVILEARDITELANTREVLRQTALDNEVLLKEVHHRVKNNLQIIISMLRMQSRSMDNPLYQANYRELINRVQSMSLIHQQLLQRSRNMGEIELDVYIKQLIHEIVRTYPINMDLNVHIESILLDIDRAITCGLIVNELVTNVMKYAFPDRRGTLEIRGKQDNDRILLEVADDGIGLAPELAIETSATTGFQLINMMRKQIAGEITIQRNNGTQITFSFPYQGQNSSSKAVGGKAIGSISDGPSVTMPAETANE